MQTFLEKNRIGVARTEAVSGTAEALDSTDATTRWTTLEMSDLSVEQVSVPIMNGIMANDESIVGAIKGTITGEQYMSQGEIDATGTSGAATFTAKWDAEKYLLAAGNKVVMTDPSSELLGDGYFTVSPSSAGCSTITQGFVDSPNVCDGDTAEGIAYTIRGGKCNLSLKADSTGQGIMMAVDTQGAVEGIVDIADIPLYSGDSKAPIARFVNTTVTLTPVEKDGSAYSPAGTPIDICTSDFDFSLNNELTDLMCQGAEDGIVGSILTNKLPTIAITPLTQNMAVYDWWTSIKAGQIYTISMTCYTDATKTAEVFSLDIARAQLVDTSGTSDSGILRESQTFNVLANLQGTTKAEKEESWILKVGAVTLDNTTV